MRRGFRIPLRGFPRPKPAARRASFRGSADDAPDAAKAVQLPEPFPVPFLPKRELVPPERPELKSLPELPPQQSGPQSKRSERPKPKPLPEPLSEPLSGQPAPP